MTEPKLKSLLSELKIHDKEEITYKRLKSEGSDKEGLKEAELRKKLIGKFSAINRLIIIVKAFFIVVLFIIKFAEILQWTMNFWVKTIFLIKSKYIHVIERVLLIRNKVRVLVLHLEVPVQLKCRPTYINE